MNNTIKNITKLNYINLIYLLLLCLLITGCTKSGNNKAVSGWLEAYNKGHFERFVKKLDEKNYPNLFQVIAEESDEELKAGTLGILLQYWIEENPANCLKQLRLEYNNHRQLISDILPQFFQYWVHLNTNQCELVIANISNEHLLWKSKCYHQLLETLYSRDVAYALHFINRNKDYKHFLAEELFNKIVRLEDFELISAWLADKNQNGAEVFAARKQFIHGYCTYYPKEILQWLDTIHSNSKLKYELWETAMRRLPEFIPYELLQYLNQKEKIEKIIVANDINQADSLYNNLLDAYLTGVMYSDNPEIAFNNITVIPDSQIQFNLRKYFYYLANKLNYSNVWNVPNNSPQLIKHKLNFDENKNIDINKNQLVHVIVNQKIIQPIKNNREFNYNFYSDKPLEITIKANRFPINKHILSSDNLHESKMNEDEINLLLPTKNKLTVYLPEGYKLIISN